MKLGSRDRRALLLLGAGAAAWGVLMLAGGGNGAVKVVGRADSIPVAERRLARMREAAATVSGKEQVLKQVSQELAGREAGVLSGDTAAQAQARLLEAVRRTARAQTPPIEFGTVDLAQEIRKLGEYGEVQLSVPFVCRIEELVNFLADLTRQGEAIATSELRIAVKDAKEKTITVRLTVGGLVPKRLIPEKKGMAAF
jgi:hypothetical protein